jgi:hypothetical protein
MVPLHATMEQATANRRLASLLKRPCCTGRKTRNRFFDAPDEIEQVLTLKLTV